MLNRRYALALLACLLVSAGASAQTGVSDDRVSLPDGPGSLEGLGSNASVEGNMGQMTYSVPIRVPEYLESVTPSLSFDYSSGSGSGPLGIGWSLDSPSIERMTARGLPVYDDSDAFVVNGSEELVRVSAPGVSPAVYRARFEGGFVRYSWHEAGFGDEGYWLAEYPDGLVSYFGADSEGTFNEQARVRSPNGVFRYLLTETVDRFGHKLVYDYAYHGAVPLLSYIGYAHDAQGNAGLSVTFDYEERQDRVSDARGGFNELLTQRLTHVRVFSAGRQIRMYRVSYEDYSTSGGASRIAMIEQFGMEGGRYPVVYTFEYSRALGGMCTTGDCEQPYLVELGNIGGNVLESGLGTLVDLNGDSLPDLVVSSSDGSPHLIYLSELAADGTHTFAPPFYSSVSESGNFILSDNTVQEVDYDGDGFADLVDHVTGQVLVNKGGGDWHGVTSITNAGGDLDMGADGDFADATSLSAADGELKNIKYFDYDGDRRIDILRAPSAGVTSIMRNLGSGGYVPADGVEDLGASFEDDNLELADMNGDGLLDPVKLGVAGVEYKINLGRGKWTNTWVQVTNSPLTNPADLPFTSLEDINGDGIDDIVVVDATEIRYAINRNGATFDPPVTITSARGVAIPQRDANSTVLFADMNGNGSNDIVWIDGAGNVTYLELYPVRPNLLARIENGIGHVTEVTYTSSVMHRARDNGVGWETPLPMALLVVDTIDSWFLLGNEALEQHAQRRVKVTGGYYDGVEKQMRGFERVVFEEPGDEHQEAATIVEDYDVGAGEDRAHFAGRLLRRVTMSDEEPVRTIEYTYEECPLADIPTSGLSRPIRFTCHTSTRTIHQERLPASEWVETLEETEYDGYGNVSRVVRHGVTSVGGAGCGACGARADDVTGAPCGAQCLGDEAFVERDYVAPEDTDGWILDRLAEERRFGSVEGRRAVTRFYYDGDAFVGLPQGQATKGALTRVEDKIDEGTYVQTGRYRLDHHGNIVEELSPRGDPAKDAFKHRYFYDALGADILREETTVTGLDGESYVLFREYTHEPYFGEVASGSDWTIEGDSAAATTKYFGYDEFGRIAWAVMPGGDTPESPTEVYEYDLGAPFSRIITRQRTKVGGPLDIEEISCVDGAGRKLQTRASVGDGRWHVGGLNIKNARGHDVYVFDGWEDTSGECSVHAPDDVIVTEAYFDGLGRMVRTIEDVDGDAREQAWVYRPLEYIFYDQQDTAGGDDASAGTRLEMDGLGRLVRSTRTLEDDLDGPGYTVDIFWDDLGGLRGFRDGRGNEKAQRRDLLGRIIAVDDPDHGSWRFAYDADGNPVRTERGDGRVVVREYDALGRKVLEWDEDDEEGTRTTFVYDRDESCPALTCSFGAHRLVSTTYPLPLYGQGTDLFGYDERGQVVRSGRVFGDVSLMQEAHYDNAGRLSKHVYPGGRSLRYEYDGLGRVLAVDGFVRDIEFDTRGLLEAYTYENGVRTELEYDSQRRLRSVKASGPSDVLDLRFERNAIGNVIGIDDRVVPSGSSSLSARYEVDALSRLISAELDPDGSDETLTLEFDDLERIARLASSLGGKSPAHVGAYQYDGSAPRGVTSAGGVDFSYDSGGQVSRRGELSFARDMHGRVTSVERGNQRVATYGFNGSGLRVLEDADGSRSLLLHSTFEVRDGVSRLRYGLDGVAMFELESAEVQTKVLSDRNGDGVINAADAWLGRGQSDLATTLKGAARRALLGDEGESVTYLHKDHLGSTIAATSEDGAVVERISYYPYGLVRGATAVQTERAAFIGHDIDAVTGLVHFGLRDLSPRDGRWLSPDPAFLLLESKHLEDIADAINAFSYALDNPISNFDIGGAKVTVEAFKAALETGGTAMGVAGLAIGATFAGAAIAAGTVGVANVVGAVIGGVVSLVAEATLQYHAWKREGSKKLSWGQKAKLVGKVLLSGAIGATAGFATGGLSAIGTVVSASASHAQLAGKLSWTDATAIRGASILTFTGMGIGGVTIGGASGAFDSPDFSDAIGVAESDGMGVADTTLGVMGDSFGEAGEAADLVGGGSAMKALKKDWKSSYVRAGLARGGRGLKAIGRGIAAGGRALVNKMKRKKQ